MKRLLCILLMMLLLLGIAFPASAETGETTLPPQVPSEVPTEAPTQPPTQPDLEVPDETTAPSVTTPVTEPTQEDATQPANTDPEETTSPVVNPESCKHSWIYVEVNPTCTEYGAEGYVCVLCEALTEAKTIDMVPHTYDYSCDPSCSVCGAERSVSHKFSSTWSRNSSQHWHACYVCGEKKDAGGHYPGPAATEEKAQYCLTCGLMMMPKKDHTHKYSQEYSTDEQEHWYACEGCEERRDAAPHSYDNVCDSECNVCGYLTVKEHSYGSWQSDQNGHWNACTLCGFSTEPENHIPGEQTEMAPLICTVCSFELAAAPEHVHEASGSWNYDENSHWKLCLCGEKTEGEPHSWDDGEETEENLLLTCTVCGVENHEPLQEEERSFPWWIPAGIAILLCAAIALTGVLLFKMRSGKY